MSNAIRYDSLLVRYLADELDGRLSGRSIESLSLDPERRVAALSFGDEALVWHLHPTEGWVVVGPSGPLSVPVPLARRPRLARVSAPPDERILIFEFASAARKPGRAQRVVVELLGNQWNLIAVGPDERIVEALWRRTTGDRILRPNHPYVLPQRSTRRGAEGPVGLDEWRTLLGPVAPRDRQRTLIDAVAYTSPINAGAILGVAAEEPDEGEVEDAYSRYVGLASLPPASPRILMPETRPQPYPLPLPGVSDTPCPTLLAAIATAAGAEVRETAPVVTEELLERLRRRIAQLDRRRTRLEKEAADAGAEAIELRRQADLLLSQLYMVQKGMDRVALPDFAGGTVEISLDPALAPPENARQLYDLAKKRERAGERLPELLRRNAEERERLALLLARAETGEADLAEVEAAIGKGVEVGSRKGEPERVLPYRRYRTSGGLEVRVGRSSRANDELTFHHSSPNDIWLHARDVAGAHVILRWSDAGANPPARDLAEAAVLASLYSRARTSGTVAVDWTRRKYVRKPRKSPPGLVAIERSKTVFVEPDEDLEKRLRVDGPSP